MVHLAAVWVRMMSCREEVLKGKKVRWWKVWDPPWHCHPLPPPWTCESGIGLWLMAYDEHQGRASYKRGAAGLTQLFAED